MCCRHYMSGGLSDSMERANLILVVRSCVSSYSRTTTAGMDGCTISNNLKNLKKCLKMIKTIKPEDKAEQIAKQYSFIEGEHRNDDALQSRIMDGALQMYHWMESVNDDLIAENRKLQYDNNQLKDKLIATLDLVIFTQKKYNELLEKCKL